MNETEVVISIKYNKAFIYDPCQEPAKRNVTVREAEQTIKELGLVYHNGNGDTEVYRIEELVTNL